MEVPVYVTTSVENVSKWASLRVLDGTRPHPCVHLHRDTTLTGIVFRNIGGGGGGAGLGEQGEPKNVHQQSFPALQRCSVQQHVSAHSAK